MRTRPRFLVSSLLLSLTLAGAACSTSPDQAKAPTAPVGATTAEPAPSQPAPSDIAQMPAATETTETAPNADDTLAARISATTPVYAEPTEKAKVVTTLGPTTPLGSRTTLLIVEQRDSWLRVSLPVRPNGSTGWIRSAGVELRGNPMAITVDRRSHALKLTHRGNVLLETKVAIGSPANPTPAGTFYVTDLVETDAPGGAYGPFALGLSGHSDTLTEFAGGNGQLGVHGTNDQSSIGRPVSHGCVRVPNDVITDLSQLVPLGTPITIV